MARVASPPLPLREKPLPRMMQGALALPYSRARARTVSGSRPVMDWVASGVQRPRVARSSSQPVVWAAR